MNKYTFSGNLTKDAEQVLTKSGIAMLRFTVAVNSGWGDKKHCDFVNCVIFGKRAEGKLSTFLVKGKSVSGIGGLILSEREYEDNTYHNLECTVDELELHGGREESNLAPNNTVNANPAPVRQEDLDIPF